jgi:hypothetical protein
MLGFEPRTCAGVEKDGCLRCTVPLYVFLEILFLSFCGLCLGMDMERKIFLLKAGRLT